MRKNIIIGCLTILFSSTVLAQDNYQPLVDNRMVMQNKATPDELLKTGIYEIIGFMRQSGALDLKQIKGFINNEISGYFDFKQMANLAAGRIRRELTGEEMQLLSHKIRLMFLSSLAKNLVDYAYTNKKIRFSKPKRARYRRQTTVLALVTHPDGFPTRLAFRFHPTPEGWKIFDLSADGQSAIVHYRRMIRKIVKNRGIDALFQN